MHGFHKSTSASGLEVDDILLCLFCFPGGSDGKASVCSVGDLGSIPGLGRSPGEGNSNPRQYPCLENLMDTGTWWAAVHGVAKSRARLSNSHTLGSPVWGRRGLAAPRGRHARS